MKIYSSHALHLWEVGSQSVISTSTFPLIPVSEGGRICGDLLYLFHLVDHAEKYTQICTLPLYNDAYSGKSSYAMVLNT